MVEKSTKFVTLSVKGDSFAVLEGLASNFLTKRSKEIKELLVYVLKSR